MVRETPRLAAKIPLTSREKGITQTFKLFPGGWLKFVHSHSADEVKSSSARYAFVEEPDECEQDVRGQGSTVKLLLERLKQFFDTFSIMGGSPTLSEISAIEAEMELTDKRKWFAPCHHCQGEVALDGQAWGLVKYKETRRAAIRFMATSTPRRPIWSVCIAEGSGVMRSAHGIRARAGLWPRRNSPGSQAFTSAT